MLVGGWLAFDEIKHTPGAGSRPAAVLIFQSADPAALARCSSVSTTYTGEIENVARGF
jgi:hypothetical protein